MLASKLALDANHKFAKFLSRDRRAWEFATAEGAVVTSAWLRDMMSQNAELQAV